MNSEKDFDVKILCYRLIGNNVRRGDLLLFPKVFVQTNRLPLQYKIHKLFASAFHANSTYTMYTQNGLDTMHNSSIYQNALRQRLGTIYVDYHPTLCS